MEEEIFRKKSLDKIKSPEDLEDYIRVSNPGVWLLLISVIVLLAGACVWGIFGKIDHTVPSIVHIEDGAAVCYIAVEDISSVKSGMTVKFEDVEAVIADIGTRGENGFTCTLSESLALADGFYEGTVVVESYRPLSSVLQRGN